MLRLVRNLAVFVLAGCMGGGYTTLPETGASLEGTVTYGKDKVMVGLVMAQGANGSATALIDDDGTYRMGNVPLGEVNLAVNIAAAKGQLIGQAMAQPKKGKRMTLPRVVEVPAKYGSPASSGIKTTINRGKNTFNIVIPK
jgi:hypothetical protein